LEALEVRLTPTSYTWKPISGNLWTTMNNWVDSGGHHPTHVPADIDVAVFDGNTSNSGVTTVGGGNVQKIGAIVTENSYTGTVSIAAGGVLEVVGGQGNSTFIDGTKVDFGSATSQMKFDSGTTLALGDFTFSGSQGTVLFYGTVNFNSSADSTSVPDWVIGDGNSSHIANFNYGYDGNVSAAAYEVKFVSQTFGTPLTVAAYSALNLYGAGQSTCEFDTVSPGSGVSTVLDNKGTIQNESNNAYNFLGSALGTGHMGLLNESGSSLIVQDGATLYIRGLDATETHSYGFYQSGGTFTLHNGFLYSYEGTDLTGGTFDIDSPGTGGRDQIESDYGIIGFSFTTLNWQGTDQLKLFPPPTQVGNPHLAVGIVYCTLNMHLDGSTNGKCSSIQLFNGVHNDINLGSSLTDTLNITQDNPVVKGSGFSWTLFATDPNDDGKVLGDVSAGTGFTNLAEWSGNGNNNTWQLRST
jgi:hypothetical protein